MSKRLKLTATIAMAVLLLSQPVNGMGLRSFVALPVDVNGKVIRFSWEHQPDIKRNYFITSGVYGLSRDKAILLAIPYKSSTDGSDSFGDLSALFRYTILQKDVFSGTSRLGFLSGVTVPVNNENDPAIQAGIVYTYFKNRVEIDIDAVYQAGTGNLPDTGRYDISLQYRLAPSIYREWGLETEVNVVTELNGRWTEGNKVTRQITLGLQLIDSVWVIEGGIIKGINNNYDTGVILSARFHF